MPTGVALGDARRQLFDAADRVLRRDGVSGLTSRAVTTEAGVAKGVLHRHFADFDDFLAALVADHAVTVRARAADLLLSPGLGDVRENVGAAVNRAIGADTIAMVTLVGARPALRERLRGSGGQEPVLSQVVAMVEGYLVAEQECGRIRHDADPALVARTLVGAVHLLHGGYLSEPPASAVDRAVGAVVGPALADWRPDQP